MAPIPPGCFVPGSITAAVFVPQNVAFPAARQSIATLLATNRPANLKKGGGICLIAYRLYFLDDKGAIQARQDFVAQSDAQARMIGGALWQACAECYQGYELWQGKRRVTQEHGHGAMMSAPSVETIDIRLQQRVLELEELLLTSHWRVAKSNRLLASANILRRRFGGTTNHVTPQEITRYVGDMTGRGMMSLQLVQDGCLKLCGSRGFDRFFDEYFAVVDCGDCACGAAFKSARQMVVAAIDASPIFAGQRSLEVLRAQGVASCISTPLQRGDGSVAGMFSIHHHKVWHPEDGELAQLSALAHEISVALADPHSAAAQRMRQPV